MNFTFDAAKRAEVLEKHRVDMLYAALIFDGPCLTWVDNRKDYGEVRNISIGMVDDDCFIVVHTAHHCMEGGLNDREKYQKHLAGRAESTSGEG
jgi:uncharacterized DUF497 family protein